MLMASMLLLSSSSYAVELGKVNMPAKQAIVLSKADMNGMLKEAGIEPGHVKMLDNGEMAQTEGEFWGWLVAFLVTAVVSSLDSGGDRVPQPPKNYQPVPVGLIPWWDSSLLWQ